ncbi:heavy-metal-associated domain-containing protein [Bythopirellula goksoeyrii]|uniref:Copper exporting ATPase n=1 Tax=Bythopirellula goksoeyrii TaxID=1400387 RepID=A0A5B9QFX0_9BACT|nr:heavy metal-associated domain-containing protein [Bythopirellula goksoeyrii]QEG35816.1 copper exporting ATPase [Bythopirellula goksoeyrii]
MEAVFSTNMKCESCLSKVAAVLDGAPGVQKWNADLSDSRKLLRVQLDESADTQQVIDAVDRAGFSAKILDESKEVEIPDKPAFTISSYKPLLLVLVYVVGATVLTESLHASFAWQRAMSYFMGFFFLGFAFFKLLNIEGFADAFATYDIIARHSRLYSLIYPWIEVTLGLLFVTSTYLFAANLATAIIMAVGLIGVISAVRQKRAIQCACLGTVFNLPMSVVTIVENSVMVAMAGLMLVVMLRGNS